MKLLAERGVGRSRPCAARSVPEGTCRGAGAPVGHGSALTATPAPLRAGSWWCKSRGQALRGLLGDARPCSGALPQGNPVAPEERSFEGVTDLDYLGLNGSLNNSPSAVTFRGEP